MPTTEPYIPDAKNAEALPMVRCESLQRLVELVLQAQKAPERQRRTTDEIVLDPTTGEPFVASDSQRARLTDLLEVRQGEDKEVTALIIKQRFYWEHWALDKDIDITTNSVTYDFELQLGQLDLRGGLVLGSVTRQYYDAKVIFAGEVQLRDAVFAGPASFRWCVFKKRAGFEAAVFQAGADFWQTEFSGLAVFDMSEFTSYANFGYTTFRGPARFWDVRFDWAHFHVASFEDEALFGGVRCKDRAGFSPITVSEGIMFAGGTFEGALELGGMKLAARHRTRHSSPIHQLIDLAGTTVKGKVMFSLADAFEHNYNQLVLGLHNSNIAYFSCDDREFEQVRLFWQDPATAKTQSFELDEDPHPAGEKTRLERYLHELRIKRRILQDMNWGDLADACYANIMDQQLALKQYDARQHFRLDRMPALFASQILYKSMFGWGIRLINPLLTLMAVISASWGGFYVLARTHGLPDAGHTALSYSLQSLLAISIPTNDGPAGHFALLGIAEAVAGYILCTLFVVILARRFMRL
jgi:hypothetical protein